MADENKKGITVKIDADLHAQVKAYIESRGMTMAEFITAACDDLLHPKITEKEEKKMENMRTVAFQVPESLFQRIKDYLQRNNMTQRQFLLGLIEAELDRDLLCLIAFAYCVVKIFFQNIKRGGILLVQMAVGSLYMFSVPRGYTDGFNQWCKQVAAICLTAFLQTSLLFLGLLTFPDHMILGLGIMLAANEVPRIAQQFGLDSSVRVNMMSVVHATTTAVNLTRSIAKASG